ncbi:MAG: hypothetical protein QM786_10360 [Breznakibacter sp.]
MDRSDMLDRLKKMFEEDPDNINILEEVIDVDLQLKYFKASVKAKKELNTEEVMANKDSLFSAETAKKEKRKLLAQLASINQVEAYRIIERYVGEADPTIKKWAILALQESRMLIHASLLDTAPVFISTGLGGKGKKLRYFAVFLSNSGEPFSNLQQSIIQGELEFVATKSASEIEKIEFHPNYCTVMILIPLKQSIKDTFGEVVTNCNEFGGFLHHSFMVTNVKKLSEADILHAISQSKDNNNQANDDQSQTQ